jgi:hypothetical protein
MFGYLAKKYVSDVDPNFGGKVTKVPTFNDYIVEKAHPSLCLHGLVV